MRILHLNSCLKIGGGLERIIVDLIEKNKEAINYLCVINDAWSEEYIELLERSEKGKHF